MTHVTDRVAKNFSRAERLENSIRRALGEAVKREWESRDMGGVRKLATYVGTSKSQVMRLIKPDSGEGGLTLRTLCRVAVALDLELIVVLQRRDGGT